MGQIRYTRLGILRILGSPRRLCDGLRRRDFLQAGALGTLGLSLPRLLQAADSSETAASAPGFGQAKACILLYLYGSPSQLETFDVKPDAPTEIRGDLGTIPTVLPSYHIGELLPQTASVLDRCTVVRSMTHPYPVHGIAYATTGLVNPQGGAELNPRDTVHWPFMGSVVDHLERRAGRPSPVPHNIALPFPLSTRRSNQPFRAGPYGGFLGPAYDPVWTDFQGEATVAFEQKNRGVVQTIRDPYIGITPECSFDLADTRLLPNVTLDRLNRRHSLLTQFDKVRRSADQTADVTFDRYQDLAFGLLTAPEMRSALDIRQEPMSLREQYGMSLWGQGSMIARRLIESGSKLVSLFWDEYGLADSAWDTHYQHYRRMKRELCPSWDQAYQALLHDLEDRGMLDETLVVCISEHGRTPQINNAEGAGRDHWSRAYSAIFAGGGFAKGRVVGETDKIAGDVVSTPISPKDIQATIYHLLGIDPHTLIYDAENRPHRISGSGEVRFELLG